MQNRKQNKISSLIFYAKVQVILYKDNKKTGYP